MGAVIYRAFVVDSLTEWTEEFGPRLQPRTVHHPGDHPMKPFHLAALAAALVLGACTSSPTDSANLTPAGPSFDGGGSQGSGNRDGGTATTTSDSTQTNRGGGSHGSGN
jgi:hypothetical protein